MLMDFRGRQAPLNLYSGLFSRDRRIQKIFGLLTNNLKSEKLPTCDKKEGSR